MITPVYFLLLLSSASAAFTRFIFELADQDVQCFFEQVENGTEFTFFFQVIAGGHYDVDSFIEDPTGNMTYRKHKISHESYNAKAMMSGVYKFCFGNRFSTFTHKKIYFQLKIGDFIPAVPNNSTTAAALTQLEYSCIKVHSSLVRLEDLHKNYHVQLLVDWLHADSVNASIMYWATAETIILFVVTIGQVVVLKKFFTEKKANVNMPGIST
ncbi:transmembrane emp24 domain-containing protein 3-like [Leucoraja erinacea]|uniref:transmembrane emp24 domain-containing protein 3-like n=1 Tax=Leucoraja erinaceus TaxID=7782 RepID=UPI0024585A58|nr:transmembrane emp24 domain-containing protein 3-like [Leucoraja erinacea]